MVLLPHAELVSMGNRRNHIGPSRNHPSASATIARSFGWNLVHVLRSQPEPDSHGSNEFRTRAYTIDGSLERNFTILPVPSFSTTSLRSSSLSDLYFR
jgi:hypothetical protein